MLEITRILNESIFFEDQNLFKDLKEKDIILGSDMFSRSYRDRVMIYYLTSSDQIEIPREYINLFQILQRREGGRIKLSTPNDSLEKFISLGIFIPGILGGMDSRGFRDIISKMTVLGTKDLRKYLKEEHDISFGPWILKNVHNTLEI